MLWISDLKMIMDECEFSFLQADQQQQQEEEEVKKGEITGGKNFDAYICKWGWKCQISIDLGRPPSQLRAAGTPDSSAHVQTACFTY